MATKELPQTQSETSQEPDASKPTPRSKAPASLGITLILALAGATAGYLVTRWFDSGTPPTYLAYITADSRTISATDDIVIDEILANEGDSVEMGTDLFSYSHSDSKWNAEELQSKISVIDEQIVTRKAKAELETSWRVKQIDSEILRENLALTDLFRKEFDMKIERDIREDILKKHSPPPRQAIEPDRVFKPAQWVVASPEEDRLREILKYNSVENSLEVMATQIDLHENRVATLRTLKEELPDKIFSSLGIEELEQQKLFLSASRERLTNEIERKFERANIYGVVRKIHCQQGDSYSKGETLVEIVNPENRFIVVHISRDDRVYFSPGKLVEIDFGEPRPLLGRVRDDRSVPTTKSLGEAIVPIVIEPTEKPWPNVPLGTPLHVTPKS